MVEHANPVAIARAFTEAWTSKDLERAALYVAEDAVFDGPLGHAEGKREYMEGIGRLASMATGLNILAAFGNNTQALIMYELNTEQYGVLTCAKLFTIQDGKIARDRLTFDSHAMRAGSR